MLPTDTLRTSDQIKSELALQRVTGRVIRSSQSFECRERLDERSSSLVHDTSSSPGRETVKTHALWPSGQVRVWCTESCQDESDFFTQVLARIARQSVLQRHPTLILSEPHFLFHCRYRSTSFHVTRGRSRSAQTHYACTA